MIHFKYRERKGMVASWSSKDLESKEQKINNIFSTEQNLISVDQRISSFLYLCNPLVSAKFSLLSSSPLSPTCT